MAASGYRPTIRSVWYAWRQGRGQRVSWTQRPLTKKVISLRLERVSEVGLMKPVNLKPSSSAIYFQHLARHIHTIERCQDGATVAIPGGMERNGIFLG